MINSNFLSAMSSADRRALLNYYTSVRNGQSPSANTSSSTSLLQSSPPAEEVVIVNATWVPSSAYNLNLAWSDSLYELGDPNTLGLEEAADQFDQTNIDITDFTGRPLTPQEQAAVNKLREVIDLAKMRINEMPDNAILRLSDGRTITGRELKDVIARLDVEIYDGRSFANKSDKIIVGGVEQPRLNPVSGRAVGGEADYNGGNPVIRLNIGGLQAYAANTGGVEYLFLHEVGHMVPAGLQNLATIGADGISPAESAAHERMANDIARALAAYVGIPTLANPGAGYDPNFPLFVMPAPDSQPNYLPPNIPGYPTYIPPGDRDRR
jgi:hypothetical protein